MRGAWLPSADASAARDGAMGAAGRLGAPRSRHHRVTPALGKGKVGADGRVPPSRERERERAPEGCVGMIRCACARDRWASPCTIGALG
jgi:hypothetical protein